MRSLGALGTVLALAILGASSTIVMASDNDKSSFMAVNGKTAQPIGHHEFCRVHSAECAIRSDSRVRVRLDQKRWNELDAVNKAVNTGIRPTTDEELFGRPEVWEFPDGSGDCEDFVLLKRRMLMEKGWPAGSTPHHRCSPDQRRRSRSFDRHHQSRRSGARQSRIPISMCGARHPTATSSASPNTTPARGWRSRMAARSRSAAFTEARSFKFGPGRVPPPVPKIRSIEPAPAPGAGSLIPETSSVQAWRLEEAIAVAGLRSRPRRSRLRGRR